MIVPPKRIFRKKTQKIHTWLRQRISPIDHGMKSMGHPIHCNRNKRVLEAFHGGRWLSRLSNAEMDDHFSGEQTYYFAGNGSRKFDETLVNIDIDCHGGGTPAGAISYAEHLRSHPIFGKDLYVESSTHGSGAHGYPVLVKGWASDRAVNAALKVLEQYLKRLMILGDYDITDVEVKGTCPEMTWGLERGRLEKYQSGQLAKLPREALRRAEELMTMTRVHIDRLSELPKDLAEQAEAAGAPSEIVAGIRMVYEPITARYGRNNRTNPPVEEYRVNLEKLKAGVKSPGDWKTNQTVMTETLLFSPSTHEPERVPSSTKRKRSRGSMEGPPVPDEIARLIPGTLLRFAKNWLDSELRAGKGNRRVHADVLAVLIAILAHSKDHPNQDGSTPTAWIKLLWKDLEERGYTDRPWDHHVYKAARDFLSRMGWLVWHDENYVVGQEVKGVYHKGQAAQWEASDYLRSIANVEDDKVEEGAPPIEEEEGEGHIYGHNTTPFSPQTIVAHLRAEARYSKAPRFAGYIGQSSGKAA